MASKAQEALSTEAIEELLNAVDKTLDRLKTLYEQYFLGIQKQAPSYIHSDVERKLRDLTQINIRNTGMRYRLATLQQKFGSYNSYWRRTLRQIENGTYARNLAKIGREAARTGAEIPDEILAAMPKRMRDQVIRDRDAALAIARRRNQDDSDVDEVPTDDVPTEDIAAVLGQSSELAGGAHVLSEADADMDFEAFFSSFEDDAPKAAALNQPPKASPQIASASLARPSPPASPLAAIDPPTTRRAVSPRVETAAGAEAPPPAPAAIDPPLMPRAVAAAVAVPPQSDAPSTSAPKTPATGVPAVTPATAPQVPLSPSASVPRPATGPVPKVPLPAPGGGAAPKVPLPALGSPFPKVPSPAGAKPSVVAGAIPNIPVPTSPRTPVGGIPIKPFAVPKIPIAPTIPKTETPAAKPEAPTAKPEAPAPAVSEQTSPVASRVTFRTGPHPKVEPAEPSEPLRSTPSEPLRSTPPAGAVSRPFGPNVGTTPGRPALRPPSPQDKPAPQATPRMDRSPAHAMQDKDKSRGLVAGITEAEVNALHAKYVKAKEMVGEKVEAGSREKLLKTIQQTAPKIMEQYKASGVDFSVVVKDNQVVIKAKPKT